MFRPTPVRCMLVAGLLAFASTSMLAQTGTKTTRSTTSKSTTEKAEKFRGRLPNNFGRIGLEEKQKDAIYAVQEKYHAEIEELEQRLEALKAKEDSEIYAILTADQKAALKELQDKRKKTTK